MAKNVTYRMRLLIVALLVAVSANAQQLGLKTNLLYWGTTTPNIGLELQTGRKHTVQAFYGINPWKFSNHKSIRHWAVQPEYRYWFCQTFNGWFLGVHAMGGQFNAGGIELPMGMLKEFKDHRYEGWFAGGGLSAGYQWPLSKHWNLETSLGLGYDYIHYKKFECKECGDLKKKGNTNYVGPTKAAIELIYMF